MKIAHSSNNIFHRRMCRRAIVGTQFTSPLVHRALGRMPWSILRVLSTALGEAAGIQELSCKGTGWRFKIVIMLLSVQIRVQGLLRTACIPSA